VTPDDLIRCCHSSLSESIRNALSVEVMPHSEGWIRRILLSLSEAGVEASASPGHAHDIVYAGYPELSRLGFDIGASEAPSVDAVATFLQGIRRFMNNREGSSSLVSYAHDDIAILGIADGIARIKPNHPECQECIEWFLSVVTPSRTKSTWSSRMRLLALDLLESRGRLRTSIDTREVDELITDIVLRNTWSSQYIGVPGLAAETQQHVLKHLLIEAKPEGDIDRSATWLKALEVLVDAACNSVVPRVSDTVNILRSVQHGLKRWIFDGRALRRNLTPVRWVIDNEYHVQSLLWAVLYPIYGGELVDETYLANWGLTQPRADLGILKLKLIIEVKFVREHSDWSNLEGEIGVDLGLYFKDTGRFDRMIIVVYDDTNDYRPERCDGFRNALMRRDKDKIEDVIFIRRPGMLPDRNQRNFNVDAQT